jgi:hypothetical protein
VWAIVLHAMANAPSLVTVPRVAVNAQRVTATASLAMVKVNVPLASLTTVVPAAMHHVHHATLTHLARHAATTTISSPVPTRTWAPKAA